MESCPCCSRITKQDYRIYIHTHTRTHLHIFIQVYTYIYTHVYEYVHVCVYIHMIVCVSSPTDLKLNDDDFTSLCLRALLAEDAPVARRHLAHWLLRPVRLARHLNGTYTSSQTLALLNICTFKHMHIYMCIYIYICIHRLLHMYTYVYISIYVSICPSES